MHHLARDRARALVDALAGRSVLVVGDVMLDHFLIGRVHRLSPEAPVPVVEHDHDEFRLGGAANVAANVRVLDGRAMLVGIVGDDDTGARVREGLAARGIDPSGLVVDPARTTTRKLRVVTARLQQVARIDYESDDDAPPGVADALIARAEEAARSADIIVISDYLKGAITSAVMSGVARAAAARRAPLLVDPKIPHLDLYAGAALVTPNQLEAETATHLRIRSDEDARHAARVFKTRVGCDSVIITRGEHGMWVLDGATTGRSEAPHGALAERAIPAAAREVADVTGAGDTVIATLALSLAAGATIVEAAEIATRAAGIVVGHFGPATVTRQELAQAIEVLGSQGPGGPES
jgi:D-glycero-beta-D-manno-heptose-7-phosphate kinase